MDHMGVLVAMSGGVDSSVTAYLLKEAGYNCRGGTMLLHHKDCSELSRRTCCSWRDIDDAAAVSAALGMPHELFDFTEEFEREIIGRFIRTYEQGGTPNPCIDCNRFMKFGLLLDCAGKMGLKYIATGHYARIEQDAGTGRWLLKKGLDGTKDQSYVLYALTQEELSRTLLPLGAMTKARVREIARKAGLLNARKRDSQDICFVPDGDYGAFMEKYTGRTYPPGDFVSPEGRVLGQHRGAVRYTLGQRRGLDLPMGERVYVVDKDMEKNTVTVGSQGLLMHRRALAEELNWIAFDSLPGPISVTAKTRYSQQEAPCTVESAEGGALVTFREGQRAMTPGQAVVFYDGDLVLGGGTIRRAFDE